MSCRVLDNKNMKSLVKRQGMKLGKPMEPDEYKRIIKKMLGFIHKVCTENGIHYYVAYGTLIGTVRHSGFIPWDDDIDIWMPNKDYLKFKEIIKTSNTYYILSAEDNKYYYNVFSRICSKEGILKLNGVPDIKNFGPFIDVFQLHKATYDKNERTKLYKDILKYNKLIQYSLPLTYYKSLSVKRKLKLVSIFPSYIYNRFFIGIEELKKKRDTIICQYDNNDTDLYYTVSENRYSDTILFTKKDLNSPINHKFEDIEVCIPGNYHELLTRRFGDYMKLPPIEQRKSHHHFTAYWR